MRHRVVQISDTHLSATTRWAEPNFEAVLAWLHADPPDLIIHTGDVVLDDPDDTADHAHARTLLDRLPEPWVVIPGNHDIGEIGGDPVTEARLAAWGDTWGADRFRVDMGRWRLIGFNLFLLDSGWPAEAEQAEWLHRQLPGAQHIALFLHKPLHLVDPALEDAPWWTLTLPQRHALGALLGDAPVRVVASGHLHRFRTSALPGGATALWAPATSFLGRDHGDGSLRRVGVVEHTYDDDGTHRARFVAPPGMHDLVHAELIAEAGAPTA